MSRRTTLALVSLAAVIGAIGGWAVARLLPNPPPPRPPTRALSFVVPAERDLLDIAVTADATRLAYTAVEDGRIHLFVRPFDRFEAIRVPDSAGATQPFFSPDGVSIGFFADGFLKTVPLDGAAAGAGATEVCPVPGTPAGAAWTDHDSIIFAGPGNTGLRQVRAAGGRPVALTTIDSDAGETAHGWPHVVDRRRIIYTVGRYGHDPRLTLLDLESGEQRPLLLADGGGYFVESGHLVYARRGEVFAAAVDFDGSVRAPSPRPVLNGAASSAAGYGRLGRSRLAAADDRRRQPAGLGGRERPGRTARRRGRPARRAADLARRYARGLLRLDRHPAA